MPKKKIGPAIAILICFCLAITTFYFYFSAEKVKSELAQKESEMQKLEQSYTAQLEEYKEFFNNFKNKTGEKIVSSNELLTFLKFDDTDKIKYDNVSFDCTGFAFEIYKRASSIGMKVGLAELEFETEARGHLLNVFQTSDKGVVFIDSTGNENGSGYDKIAFAEKGKKYKAIIIPNKDEFTVCNFKCRDLPKISLDKKKYDLFSKEFLSNVENCTSMYNDCVKEYNREVENYNSGIKTYDYGELKRWQSNLEQIKEDFTINDTLILVEGDVIKNIQIYW